ncbi:MAG: hypothetical protein ACYCW6_04765 [Candidatus Xenobia bacterium]
MQVTPYQRIKNSVPGRFVRQHPVLSGMAAVGSGIVVAGGAARSPAFSSVAQYGLAPAAGAGAAVLGASMIQDALVNDLHDHKARAAGKLAAGSALTLGGAQTIGTAWHVPVLDSALTWPLEQAFNHGLAITGAGVLGGGVAAGAFAWHRFGAAKASAEHRGANVALGIVGSAGSLGGVLGGTELMARDFGFHGLDHVFTATINALSQSPAAALGGGALLAGGSAVLAGEALDNFRKHGNDILTVAEGMGAVTTGLGGLELAGHGLGIHAAQGLLTHNLDTLGSVALAAEGAALTREAAHSMRQHGLGVGNSLALTAGLSAIPGGAALGLQSFHLAQAADLMGRASGAGAGVGLGFASAALVKHAMKSAREGEVANAAAAGTGAAITATGSLLTVGESLHIPAVTHLAHQMGDHVVGPLFDHVISPAGHFLYANPVLGAAIIVAGVGAAAWLYGKKGA